MSEVNIPKDWEETNLGNSNYFRILGSGIKYFKGKKDYLSTSSIEKFSIVNVEEIITFEKRPSRANMQPIENSIWFAKMKNTLKVISPNSYIQNRCILSTGFAGIFSSNVSSSYLFQVLLSEEFNKQKDCKCEGTTQEAINNENLKKILIKFPKSLKEQEKIATILTSIDNNIEKTQELIEKNKKIKDGLMQDLFAPKEDWEKKTLNQITEVISGGTPDTNVKKYWDGENVWITPDDFKIVTNKYIYSSYRKISDLGLKESSANLIPENSIVMSSRAPIGYLGIVKNKFSTNQGCKSFICKTIVNNEFLYYALLFNVDKIKSKGEGTTFAEISKKQLEQFSLKIPKSLKEQEKIATILISIDNTIEKTQELIEKNKKIKDGLMQDLLTGNKKVRL